MLLSFVLSVASGIVTTLVVVTVREVRRMASTVTESANAVSTVTATVATLQSHDAQNRERIAALWARVFPNQSPWSTPNDTSRPRYGSRVN